MSRRDSKYRSISVKEVQIIPEAVADSRFNRHTIQGLLDQCPKWIYQAGLIINSCDKALSKLKQELKVDMAKYQLEASAKKDVKGFSSDSDRKAYVDTQESVKQLNDRIILAQGDLTMAKLQKEKFENYFTAVRKHASLLISEDELTRADKYQGKQEN